jgi:hypothetical protein
MQRGDLTTHISNQILDVDKKNLIPIQFSADSRCFHGILSYLAPIWQRKVDAGRIIG